MAWLCEDCMQRGCRLLPETLRWNKQTNEQIGTQLEKLFTRNKFN